MFNMTDVIEDYSNSNAITDERLRKLNKNYYDFLEYNSLITSGNNIRAVAYMMDTNVWNPLFCDDAYADYAIGGPTIELLFQSYNQKYNTNFLAGSLEFNDSFATATIGEKGYYISFDGGENWQKDSNGEEVFSKDDSIYIMERYDKAFATWLATPDMEGGSLLFLLYCGGNVAGSNYKEVKNAGFRPIVCLNSNVKIVAEGENYKLEK